MRKAKIDELRSEYSREDLGNGVRGKYYKACKKGTNVVLLNPNVAKVFPNDEAVNEALKSLINISQKFIGLSKRINRHVKVHN